MSVYFLLMHSKDRLIKIGKSKSPYFRITSFPETMPFEVEIVATTNLYEEDELHERFAHLRIKGEWFTYNKEIEDFIESIKENEPHLEMPEIHQKKWRSFFVNEEDQDIVEFICKDIGGSMGNAIKKALWRYAATLGYKSEKPDKIADLISSYEKDVTEIAKELARGDVFLAEELRSEMYIFLLTSKSDDKVINMDGAKKKATIYMETYFTSNMRLVSRNLENLGNE